MKDAGSPIALATAEERAASMPDLRSCDEPSEPMPDVTEAHQLDLTRAIRLGQLLRVRVLIDDSGWLRGDVEIAYQRERCNMTGRSPSALAWRYAMRMCSPTADPSPCATGTMTRWPSSASSRSARGARARRTGDAPTRLADRRGASRAGWTRRDDRRAPGQAHGHGVVRLRTLVLLERRHAQLAAIVSSSLAERSVSTSWDGDTQEMDLVD